MGAGWVARAHVASWMKTPFVRVFFVSDPYRERAEQLANDSDSAGRCVQQPIPAASQGISSVPS